METVTKIKAKSRVAIGVTLVCLGVALGAVAFNALVPAVFAPTSGVIADSAAVPATWNYVLGPGKCTLKDYNTLLAAIKNSSEVKVIVNNSSQECVRTELTPPDAGNILCYFAPFRDYQLAGPSYFEESKRLGINKNNPCNISVFETNVAYYADGTKKITPNDYQLSEVKWYIRK